MFITPLGRLLNMYEGVWQEVGSGRLVQATGGSGRREGGGEGGGGEVGLRICVWGRVGSALSTMVECGRLTPQTGGRLEVGP